MNDDYLYNDECHGGDPSFGASLPNGKNKSVLFSEVLTQQASASVHLVYRKENKAPQSVFLMTQTAVHCCNAKSSSPSVSRHLIEQILTLTLFFYYNVRSQWCNIN